MDSPSGCVKAVPIFSSLTDEELVEVAKITRAQTFKKGEMVYMAGDRGGTLFVLHTGRVKINRINLNGKEQVIRFLGPGDFMGELSLFSESLLTDNAQVLEESTMCIIEGEKLKELMQKYGSMAIKVMGELSKRLEEAENLIESISLKSVEQRIAESLLTLSEGEDLIQLKMTKGDLASQLGMSQESLSRKLSAFQEEGYIELIGHRKVRILDRDGLEEME